MNSRSRRLAHDTDSRKRRRGCLRAVLVVAGVFLLAAATWLAWLLGAFDVGPVDAAVPDDLPGGSEAVAETYQAKQMRLAHALETGTRDEFRLSAEDLNRMIAEAPPSEELQGTATVEIQDGRLVGDLDYEIDVSDYVPLLGRQQIQAVAEVGVLLQDGELQVRVFGVRSRGQGPQPSAWARALSGVDLARALQDTHPVRELKRCFEQIAVLEDTLLLVTRERDVDNAAGDAPTSGPGSQP